MLHIKIRISLFRGRDIYKTPGQEDAKRDREAISRANWPRYSGRMGPISAPKRETQRK